MECNCEKCNGHFEYHEDGAIYPGGKDKEDIICPYCGEKNGTIMTSGFVRCKKIVDKSD